MRVLNLAELPHLSKRTRRTRQKANVHVYFQLQRKNHAALFSRLRPHRSVVLIVNYRGALSSALILQGEMLSQRSYKHVASCRIARSPLAVYHAADNAECVLHFN